MQPILLLAIAGVAVAAMSAGFLTNDIQLLVQEFGAGETTINSPVDNALIDFVIDRTTFTIGTTSQKLTRNVIDVCIVEADKTIDKGSTIICKLTDANNNVVAEGSKLLATKLNKGVPTNVDINDLVNPNLPSNDVTNIHDVVLVVQGPKVTGP
jgi:hypothetical protein